jgi:hypothetical protein
MPKIPEKTPGSLLAEIIKRAAKGENTSDLKKEFEEESCNALSIPGSRVTMGEFEAIDGGTAKKIRRTEGMREGIYIVAVETEKDCWNILSRRFALRSDAETHAETFERAEEEGRVLVLEVLRVIS